jgi:hypothetical protein
MIFYIVYLKISSNNNNNNNNKIKKLEIEPELEPELELENFGNNIEKSKFDIHNFYSNLSKSEKPSKISKDNYDYDYETDFKYKDTPIVADDNIEHFLPGVYYPKRNLNLDSQGGGNILDAKPFTNIRFQEESPNFTSSGDTNFLVPNDLDSNATYSVPFPENTSIELAQFNADNVVNLYNANTMEDLYNNINSDVYRGYRTMKYML